MPFFLAHDAITTAVFVIYHCEQRKEQPYQPSECRFPDFDAIVLFVMSYSSLQIVCMPHSNVQTVLGHLLSKHHPQHRQKALSQLLHLLHMRLNRLPSSPSQMILLACSPLPLRLNRI